MLKLLEAAIIVLIILDFFVPSTFPGRLQGRALGGWRWNAYGSVCGVCVPCEKARQRSRKQRVYVLLLRSVDSAVWQIEVRF